MPEVIFALIGVVIGILGTLFIHSRERKDKYLFMLIEDRFRVAQDAYKYSQQMKSVIHGDDDYRIEVLSKIREWFNENNLYLPPDIRTDFDVTITNVDNYKMELQHYRDLKRDGENRDGENEEAANLHSEIMMNFKSIGGLPGRIERSLNRYYKYFN